MRIQRPIRSYLIVKVATVSGQFVVLIIQGDSPDASLIPYSQLNGLFLSTDNTFLRYLRYNLIHGVAEVRNLPDVIHPTWTGGQLGQHLDLPTMQLQLLDTGDSDDNTPRPGDATILSNLNRNDLFIVDPHLAQSDHSESLLGLIAPPLWAMGLSSLSSLRVLGRFLYLSERLIGQGEYTPGSIEGSWEGMFFIPVIELRADVIPGGSICQQAMSCQLREYHAFNAQHIVDWEDIDGDGLVAAWLPRDIHWEYTATLLTIYDSNKDRSYQYLHHVHSTASPVFDTLIVGKSFPVSGTSTPIFNFHGRVRHSDGCIALVRSPASPIFDFMGTWVFYGHVYGYRRFTGQWQMTAAGERGFGQSGSFALSRSTIHS